MDSTPQTAQNTYIMERTWAPRMWIGADFFGWLRIMTRGGFQFNLPHVHIGVCASLLSFGQTVLKCAQNALYRRQIEKIKIEKPPIFIVGHWRTGTTLLHEFLILDQQHTYPNTYQCMAPNHFLLTENYFKKWFWFLMPERRPMDNMSFGWDRPQEDEFAMCLLGLPSPYLDIAFPNRPPMTPGALDLEGLTPSERRNWKRVFHRFIQTLTFRDSRRLVLKSPPHSCRIKTLLELYPDARFVHIVRNPYHVFPSTVKLWKKLAETQGVQTPQHQGIEERVLQTLPHLYAKLEEGKKLVDPARFHELRYEDLIQDPLGEMRKLYDHLEMSGFEDLRPRLESYLIEHANYETNKFQMTPDQRQVITDRWGHVIRQYGYPIDAIPAMPNLDSQVPTKSQPDNSEPILLPFPNQDVDSEVSAPPTYFRAA